MIIIITIITNYIVTQALLCVLQHLALRTAAGRSHELMLFSAGSLGP